MIVVKIILFVFANLIFINSFSKDSTKVKKNYIDSNYIIQYPYPTAYANILYKYNNIGIIDTSLLTIKFMPNCKYSIGTGFAYKWFVFKLSLFSFGSKNENIYGKTTKFDIQAHFYLKRFVTDFVYQDYKGFYTDSLLRKTNEIPINTHQVYLNNNLDQQSLGASIMYFTNHRRFSFKSTFSQNEFQKKSAGAWAFGLSFHYLSLSSDSGIIPKPLKMYIDSTSYYKSISSFNAGVIGGYFHTFTLRKWYTTIATLIGFEGKYGENVLEDGIVKQDTNYFSSRFQIRFGTGFNFNRFYYGMSVIGDGYLYNNSFQQYGVVRFYIGYRFLPKKNKL